MYVKILTLMTALFLASAASVKAADSDSPASSENTTYTGSESGSAPNSSGISTSSDSGSRVQPLETPVETGISVERRVDSDVETCCEAEPVHTDCCESRTTGEPGWGDYNRNKKQ
jgi:hypothetical protein